jgi:hypothetical protein
MKNEPKKRKGDVSHYPGNMLKDPWLPRQLEKQSANTAQTKTYTLNEKGQKVYDDI